MPFGQNEDAGRGGHDVLTQPGGGVDRDILQAYRFGAGVA